jgi:hypothetical protein
MGPAGGKSPGFESLVVRLLDDDVVVFEMIEDMYEVVIDRRGSVVVEKYVVLMVGELTRDDPIVAEASAGIWACERVGRMVNRRKSRGEGRLALRALPVTNRGSILPATTILPQGVSDEAPKKAPPEL